MVEFDHVIMAAADIDRAADRLWTDFGLASVPGGRHEGHGTGNRIVPLGPDYLEIIGVLDSAEARASPLGRWVRDGSSEGDRLAALCLRTDDLEGVAKRLDLDLVSMSRSRPDGAVLSWTTAGLGAMLGQESLPFFITWHVAPDLHPGAEQAGHRVVPHGISWVEMGADPTSMRAWVEDDVLDLRAGDGPPGVTAVAVATSEGIIELRN